MTDNKWPMACLHNLSKAMALVATEYRPDTPRITMTTWLRPQRTTGPTKTDARKSFAKNLTSLMITLAILVIIIQFLFSHNYVQQQQQHWLLQQNQQKEPEFISSSANVGVSVVGAHYSRSNEFIMMSKEEAYMRECQLHYKGNATWGKLHAPLVDKIEAKKIVSQLNIPSLKIIPTLAILDKKNISSYSLAFMQSLPQPYIIKATHQSGG